MVMVPIEELVLDFDLYPRSEVSAANVKLLAEAVECGATLPPIIADRRSKRVADGFHRIKMRKAQGFDNIAVEWHDYPDDASLYEAAIILNRAHGLPLQRYDLRRAIARLEELGYERDRISEIVRIPVGSIEKIATGFAESAAGRVVPIKRGLDHLRGTKLTKKAERANEGYAGFPAAFYAKQVRMFLATNPPISSDLVAEMEALIAAWSNAVSKKAS